MNDRHYNLIAEINSLLRELERISKQNKWLRQAIIIHTIETGKPVHFLTDLDFDGVNFDKVNLSFGDTVNILNGLSRTPITDLETLKKVYGNNEPV